MPAASIADELRAFARAEGLRDAFPEEVNAEVARFVREPGVDDPSLTDLRSIPFVTVDGPHTLDLDQAFHVSRSGTDYRLLYAIADASYYVAHGSALLAEALARGSSYYFPGFSLPMLPRALSEGLVSLNPGKERRALVFDVTLDARTTVTAWRLVRARVASRRKLAFEEVERLVAEPTSSALCGEDFAESLRLFVEIGDKRAVHEDRKHIVRYRRVESEVRLKPNGALEVIDGARGRVELATEQVSILCNALGAQLLAGDDRLMGPVPIRTAAEGAVQPIYRIHPAPDPERVAAFERLVRAVASTRGLPDDPWVYRRAAEAGMAGYLESLPTRGPEGRLARALHRQAMLLNGRSTFTSEPGEHYGVGEAVYSRFTAPMREMVGIFCHKEALERLGQRGRPREEDEAVRAAVIDAANRAKDIQRRVDREIDRRIVRAALQPDGAHRFADRPDRSGTIMGIAGSKIHVLLDEPPIDLKVALRDQGQQAGGAWLEAIDDGASLVERESRKVVCMLGDAVRVRAISPESAVIVGRDAS